MNPVHRHATDLVVGGDGAVGAALVQALRARGTRVEITSRRVSAGRDVHHLDLRQSPAQWPLPEFTENAFLLAGVTSLADCERDPEGTARINVHHLMELARRLVDRGVRLFHVSTNLVFDGDSPMAGPQGPFNPRCEYGRQKRQVEEGFLSLGNAAAVLRTTKIIWPGMPLLRDWTADLRSRSPVQAFSDLWMAPVSMRYLIEAIVRLRDRRASGIFQISADRDISYAEAALHMAARMEAPTQLVKCVRSYEAGVTLVAAPRYTTLDSTRMRDEMDMESASSLAALDEVVTQ